MFRRFVLALIELYRKGLSPFTPPSCRFVPTCSGYAHEAVTRFGVRRGGWLFLKRFARCHPFGGSGYDPVPGARCGARGHRVAGAAGAATGAATAPEFGSEAARLP